MKKTAILLLCAISIFFACEKNNDIESVFNRAEKLETDILKSINSIAECKHSYEKILIEAPESEFAPIACYKLGKLNEIFGHYEEAIDYYQKLASLYPENPVSGDGLFNMAQIYQLHLNQGEKAIFTYDQFISLYPDNKAVLQANIEIDQIYCQKEKWGSAVETFQQVVDKYPGEKISDDIYFRMADITQFKLKNDSTASNMYQELIKKFPNSSWLKNAEARLADLKK